tara:strand:- start:2621 stop:3298 length:678 start_codon:yes stop_codon:yes gene_type:complete
MQGDAGPVGFITSLFPKEVQFAAHLIAGATYGSPFGGGKGGSTWSQNLGKIIYGVGTAVKGVAAVANYKNQTDSIEQDKNILENNKKLVQSDAQLKEIELLRTKDRQRSKNLVIAASQGILPNESHSFLAADEDYQNYWTLNYDKVVTDRDIALSNLDYKSTQLDIAKKAAGVTLAADLGTLAMDAGAYFKPEEEQDIIIKLPEPPKKETKKLADIGPDLYRRQG